MKINEFNYSILSKTLQVAAVGIASALILIKCSHLFSHVDLHAERTKEWEQLEREVEKKQGRESYDRWESGEGSDRDQRRAQDYIEKNMS